MELHKSIFLLFTVMISSDTVEVKNLPATEGGSITLPDPVEEFGFLIFVKNIAMVNERRFQILEEMYKDKVLWDKNTGLFTIRGLQRNDSGIYTIDSKKGKVFTTSYRLTVYESVPTPAVNVSVESCTLLCSVENAAEQLTLSWYKDEEIVIQNSSALSLPLTVHKQDFSSSYRCVAANPAEQKTVTVDVKTSCSEENKKDSNPDKRQYLVTYIIPIVSVVIIICIAVIIKQKCLNKKETTTTQDSVNSEQEVQYTEINRVGYRPSEGGPDSSGPVDRSNLTTVYDKLEAHRMVDSDTADYVYDQTYPHI